MYLTCFCSKQSRVSTSFLEILVSTYGPEPGSYGPGPLEPYGPGPLEPYGPGPLEPYGPGPLEPYGPGLFIISGLFII